MQTENMWQFSSIKKFTLLAIATVFVSCFFAFLGAPLARVLRNIYSRWLYWSFGLISIGVIFLIQPTMLAYSVAAIWVTIGVYSEFEENGWAGFGAGAFSVALGSLLQIITPYYLSFREDVEKMTNSIGNQADLGLGISQETILSLLPSGIIVANLLALVFALVLDKRMGQLAGLRFERIASQIRLLDFQLPDFTIWIMLLSFLFSFLEVGNKLVTTIAMNTFVVMMAFFFLQGLAVIEFGMLLWRLGFFWRLPFYLFVVGQLFFILSLIGVLDYWVNFRARMRRWRFSEKNSKNGEHI